MAKILFWNIQQFGLNKIADPVNAMDSASRLAHITGVFTNNPPDIIVIAEISASNSGDIIDGTPLGFNPKGGTAVLGGRDGVIRLLKELRTNLAPTWSLIPPLALGDLGFREGVAVYFNSNTLEFTGPYAFSSFDPLTRLTIYRGADPNGPTGGFVIRSTYPNPWYKGAGDPDNVLPAALVNANSPYNRQIPQEELAGKFMFEDANQVELGFPYGRTSVIRPPTSRAPFLTTFYEPTSNRTICLYSVHTSPDTANLALEEIAKIADIQARIPNQVSVIVGDFNVDAIGPAIAAGGSYTHLMNLGFSLELSAGTDAQARTRHLANMTHLLPAPNPITDQRATPYTTSNPAGNDPVTLNTPGFGASPGGPYPSLGYAGTLVPAGSNSFRVNYEAAIDNVLIRYGGGTAVKPASQNVTVVNTIVGVPYAGASLPPHTVLGTYAYPATFAQPLPPGGVGRAADQPNQPLLTQFFQWQNYGVVRSTSDHLAIVFEV